MLANAARIILAVIIISVQHTVMLNVTVPEERALSVTCDDASTVRLNVSLHHQRLPSEAVERNQ